MTGFLASVRTAHEALIALDNGADIIDFKEPAQGALGALPHDVIVEAVHSIGGRKATSATIGDIELMPEQVAEAIERTAGTGVDFVKIGLFPGDLAATLHRLAPLAQQHRLIAVAFADRAPVIETIDLLAEAGFAGFMLDTAAKDSGALTAHLDLATLGRFVNRTRELGMIAGLAGSLRLADVAALLPLGADYLGFRSALTIGKRHSDIDAGSVAAVSRAIGYPRASSAIAVAGAASAANSDSSGGPSTRSAKLR